MRLKRRRLDFPGGPAGYLDLDPVEAAEAGKERLPVALVHGFAGDALTWQFVLPHLAHRRRVVAVDLPGHGGSTQDVGDGDLEGLAAWLWRALDALGLGRVCLIGHSMGGKIALLATLARPDRVAALGLLAPAGIAPAVDVDLLRRTLEARSKEEAEACVAALFADPPPLLEAMAKALLSRTAGPVPLTPLRTILETAFAVDKHWGVVDWDALPARRLVAWGAADRLLPLPAPAHLPREEWVHLLPGVGHLPHLEAPSRVNALLDNLLQTD
jgi:pimeloyl-ACP methyl ester carboxylesterase